ncbi:MAG TPA: acetate/propionate family kinase [Rhodanobacter sp.]
MSQATLTLNAGSSSIKFALYELGLHAQHPIVRGAIEGIGEAPRFTVRDSGGAILESRAWEVPKTASHEDLLRPLLAWIDAHLGETALVAAGHRIVHGGASFDRPVRIDAPVLAELERLVPLAPLHQPHQLAAVKAAGRLRPDLLQVACFDTAFHSGMPAVATRVALPHTYAAGGVRRYGFHGLSYEYLAGRLRELAPAQAEGRVIMAHLGNGASLCATRQGRSIDTTMGFSTLDGLVMGTRCGSLDPGVVLHLLQADGMDAAAIERLLYRESGLLGVSGISGDMRTLLASDSPAAREAIDLFVYRIVKEIGALASALGGLDALVFSAGIGERSAAIRSEVCGALAWLGVECDELANDLHETRISTSRSAVRVFVIRTDEEAMIARHTAELMHADSPGDMAAPRPSGRAPAASP